MYVRFAIKDLFSQRFICSVLFLLFFFVSVAVFSGSIFERGAINGTELTKTRLGSDIIVVPSEYGNDVQNSLFEGKACTVNLDSDWAEKISAVDGVNRVSAERYIATLNAECCSAGGIQMIAYDPKTDFTVGAWLSEQNITAPKTDEIIVGSEAGFEQGQTVSFFGREFKVIGVLDHTGMGYDTSAFISFDSAREVASTEGYSMVFPTEDGKEQVSMLLIDVASDQTPEEVRESIIKKYGKEGISAYSITSLVSNLMEKLSGISTLVTIFNVFLLITAGIAVFAVVSLNLFQRRVILGRLISVGVTSGKIVRLISLEYALVMIGAAISAIIITIVLMYPMESFLRSTVQMPYAQPGFGVVAWFALKTFLLDAMIAVIALVYVFSRQLKKDGALIVKEDIR